MNDERQAEQVLRDAAERARRRTASTTPKPIAAAAERVFAMPKLIVVDDAEAQRQREREATRARETRTRDLIAQARIPKRYQEASLDAAAALPADARGPWLVAAGRLRAILDSDAPFVLAGRRGPGKTHMACGAIRECCASGRSAMYGKMATYIAELKASFHPTSTRDAIAVERDWLRPHLLVLDEEQERANSTFEDYTMPRLIDLRYDDEKPTLIISNQTTDQLEVSLGASIVGRVEDYGDMIICDWPSVRGRLGRNGRGSR